MYGPGPLVHGSAELPEQMLSPNWHAFKSEDKTSMLYCLADNTQHRVITLVRAGIILTHLIQEIFVVWFCKGPLAFKARM